jgi:hypothetical protein
MHRRALGDRARPAHHFADIRQMLLFRGDLRARDGRRA